MLCFVCVAVCWMLKSSFGFCEWSCWWSQAFYRNVKDELYTMESSSDKVVGPTGWINDLAFYALLTMKVTQGWNTSSEQKVWSTSHASYHYVWRAFLWNEVGKQKPKKQAQFLAGGEAYKSIFWPTPGLKEDTFAFDAVVDRGSWQGGSQQSVWNTTLCILLSRFFSEQTCNEMLQ